ncbi:MAG TPA: polyprenyl diphosphate synthase [Gammaproteobacteria bacterium]|nr:polyprenyl diphosphate synthase [Gammaproteobacteria bacterium]
MTTIRTGALPAHVAVIMDGNGRWAKHRHLPRHAGHQAGLKAARRVIEHCAERGVKALTLFTFSSENWQRPQGEVTRLMELFLNALGKDVRELHGNGVRVRFIGERKGFSAGLQQGMREGETLTAANTGLMLNIAVGYGGRWDIVEAARSFAREVEQGTRRSEELDEQRFTGALSLSHVTDPDLFIRTGGERRISNFLLWNLAYTELYFTDLLWPDFDTRALDEAFAWFGARDRRYGQIVEPEEQAGA